MTPTTRDRAAARDLAYRIEVSLTDPSIEDEAGRPPSDRPPGYAESLMSEKPASVARAVGLDTPEWELIAKALRHYEGCAA